MKKIYSDEQIEALRRYYPDAAGNMLIRSSRLLRIVKDPVNCKEL